MGLASSANSKRSWSILIVDDSSPDRTLIREYFRDAGLNINLDEASSGEQCYKLVHDNDYDCIFIDYKLHDTNGLEVLKKLSHGHSSSALILLTGHDHKGLGVRALQQGAADFLCKDEIGPETLARTLHHSHERQKLLKRLLENEERLREATKLEALGLVSAGISHNYNNVLSVILGMTGLLMAEDLPEPLKDMVKTINVAAEKGSKFTAQLMSYSHRGNPPQIINVNTVIRNLKGVFRELLGPDVDLVFELMEQPALADLSAAEFEQSLLNLCANARDAMDKKGRLSIRTATTTFDQKHWLTVAIEDTGCGIEAKNLEKIFEPFYSSKSFDKGTGLGLATVQNFVLRSQGLVKVESEVNAGTTILLHFPLAQAPERAAEAESVHSSSPLKNMSVLVVEDNENLLKVFEQVLSSFNFDTHTAECAESALQVIAAAKNRFDAILTDIELPGMSGIELINRVQENQSKARVIFTSGYSLEELESRGHDVKKIATILYKPFRTEDLERILLTTLSH